MDSRNITRAVCVVMIGWGASAIAAQGSEVRFQWNGSGCAKSESATNWDPMVLQLVANKTLGGEFQVKKGGGASPKDARKTCDLIVSSTEPMQFALEQIELKGSGVLPNDAKVDLSIDVSSQGAAAKKTYALQRPVDQGKAYVLKQDVEDKELFWSECGRALQVSTKQLVRSGVIVDSKIDQLNLNFQAKACKK